MSNIYTQIVKDTIERNPRQPNEELYTWWTRFAVALYKHEYFTEKGYTVQ